MTTPRPTPQPIPVQRSMSRRLWALDLFRRLREDYEAQQAQANTTDPATPGVQQPKAG